MKNKLNNIIKEKSLSDLWGNFKHSSGAILGIPKGQERNVRQKIKFKLWPNTSQIF